MTNKANPKLPNAQQKVGENIQEFVSDYYSVAEMYERTAKALAVLMHVSPKLSIEDKDLINNMVQDHICLLDLLEPFNEKGGEV